MTTGTDRYEMPKDLPSDIAELATAVVAFGSACETLHAPLGPVLSDLDAGWSGGVAGIVALARVVTLRESLGRAVATMDTVEAAVRAYETALTAARADVEDVRGRFDDHWPSGSEEPCVDGKESFLFDIDHLTLLGELDGDHASAMDAAKDAVDACRDVLNANRPDLPEGFSGRSPLGEIPEGFWLERNKYIEDLMELSDDELNDWLASTSREEIERLFDGLDQPMRAILLDRLMRDADPLLLPKIVDAVPGAQPNPGDGAGWTTPGSGGDLPIFPEDVEGHDWMNDINQGSYGDCWYLATLAGVVDEDPDWVQNHVVPNANGTVTVYLYDDKGNRVPVTVSGELPTGDGQTYRGVRPGSGDLETGPAWPAYVEKAMAQFYDDGDGTEGTYGNIEGDWPKEAGRALTGNDSDEWDDSDNVSEALEDGRTVVASTPGEFKSEPMDGIVSGHAYTITSESDGRYYVRNPWGTDHPGWMTREELDRYFNKFTAVER